MTKDQIQNKMMMPEQTRQAPISAHEISIRYGVPVWTVRYQDKLGALKRVPTTEDGVRYDPASAHKCFSHLLNRKA